MKTYTIIGSSFSTKYTVEIEEDGTVYVESEGTGMSLRTSSRTTEVSSWRRLDERLPYSHTISQARKNGHAYCKEYKALLNELEVLWGKPNLTELRAVSELYQ